jgi:hypothetical protein
MDQLLRDETRFGVNPMTSIGLNCGIAEQPAYPQLAVRHGDKNGGRYRIRTYDFHRVKVALYR